ncbi:ABC transporter ATP-binding protein [Nonomuraea turcica]|uniref:ABC transporter ATP-binding protein n=1 Tax=Nonomuraea sp. G32 TaxID=3067274 RepID=UPI00273CEB43|nr:ABC transporter ATP-binding protein [Nonomuraea sp. G32]MDP4500504.1 ABC transporter ATP-binding protein [Nonomuraea sp. G32]
MIDERVRLMRLLPLAGYGSLAGLLVLVVLIVLSGPALALLIGALVSGAVRGENVAWVLAGLLGVLLLSRLARPLGDLVMTAATRRIDGALRAVLRRTALGPSTIAHLEEADFQDDALRASEIGEGGWVRSAGTAAYSSVLLSGRVLAAGGSALLIAVWFPRLALFLFAASLLSRALQRRQWTFFVAFGDQLSGGQRRLDYLDELAAGLEAAKEIRLFGLADWLVMRRASAHWELRSPMWALRRSILRRQGLAVLLSVMCAAGAFLVPGIAAASGTISVATLATCLVAAFGIFEITFVGRETFDIEYGKGAVEAVDRLTSRYGIRHDSGAAKLATIKTPAICFDQVEFRYPRSERPILHGLDFTISPGEVVAIVGVNGAGKTTLTKLLAGLYEPTAGRILVDGHDLTICDVEAWRRRLSVVYQDFLRYPATVRDNVILGAPEHPADDTAVREAARRAGADWAGLPDGLDTQLWRTGSGGRDLSGGQWQKLAIARTLYATAHGRDLIILDEPTAGMDVSAEIEFFEKVVSVARADGVSVVLISHRLSTIRNADRIVVLEGGRITESGSHEALLAHGTGTYARLWRLQASRFEEAAP